MEYLMAYLVYLDIWLQLSQLNHNHEESHETTTRLSYSFESSGLESRRLEASFIKYRKHQVYQYLRRSILRIKVSSSFSKASTLRIKSIYVGYRIKYSLQVHQVLWEFLFEVIGKSISKLLVS